MAAARNNTSGSRDKRKSTTQPVGEVSELLTFWDRAFDLKNGYRGLTVEVLERKNNVLSFYVLDEEGNPQRREGELPFTINLDDGMEVWSSLPSTAQDVDPESSQRIGYLFVGKQWLVRHQGDIRVKGGGAKWPVKASL
ncbi:MAG: hypothetical protein Q8N23_07025 [Archangium sp.]|nr:hypothetical protein [Archangium sp.]MDP3574042.1 hypothetical protein [Archangium sp.]